MKLNLVNQLYQITPYKDILHDIGDVVVPLDTNWRNIGISVSGGADSALLAYLLCDIINSNDLDISVHVINHVRCWKTRPWQKHNADLVYNWLLQRFYHTKFQRHINFVPPDLEWGTVGPNIVDEYGQLNSGDIIEIRAFAEYVGFTKNLDAYYNAVTRNPTFTLEGAMDIRNIEPTVENLSKMITTHMGRVSSHPFRFVDKSWIYQQYKQLDIMDLYNITRSCEGEFEHINYQSYIPGQHVPTCGKCFWCAERAWAEAQ